MHLVMMVHTSSVQEVSFKRVLMKSLGGRQPRNYPYSELLCDKLSHGGGSNDESYYVIATPPPPSLQID
jgi:hypothetical protein